MSRSPPPPPPPPPQTPPRGSCRAFRSLKSTLGWRLRHQSAPGTRARLSFSSPAPSSPLRRPPAPVPPSVHSAREEGRKNRARVPISESRDHPNNVNHEFMPDELFITKCRSDDVWEDTGAMHLMFACQFRMSWKIARRAAYRGAPGSVPSSIITSRRDPIIGNGSIVRHLRLRSPQRVSPPP